MNYGEIKKTDIANGIGVRVTLFVSGCTRHCKNCFNAETWDFNYGKPFTKETEDEVLAALAPGFINGLTLLGGEPMEPQNQRALVPFLHRVRKLYPEKDIWCYSGSTLETDMLKDGGRNRCEVTDNSCPCSTCSSTAHSSMNSKTFPCAFAARRTSASSI